MGDLNGGERLLAAVEWPLSWGPVVRGVQTGDGPGIALVLHEPGADLDAWGQLPGLLASELPLTVIALDLPGHGLSDDPWEPQRLGEVVRAVLGGFASPGANASPTISPHPNPSPVEPGEGLSSPLSHLDGRGGQGGEGVRRKARWFAGLRFLIAAGATATAALEITPELDLSGVVCLSPEAPDPGRPIPRSPEAPKLLVAGSFAGNDLQTARRLGARGGGWTVVTSLPIAARGTGLLAASRSTQLVEAIVAFLRDCARRPAPARLPPPRG